MGADLDSRTAWSVGSIVAEEYVRRVGAQPPKDLRPKTNGPGSHCFAIYPPMWESLIRSTIQAHIDTERSQGDLFASKD